MRKATKESKKKSVAENRDRMPQVSTFETWGTLVSRLRPGIPQPHPAWDFTTFLSEESSDASTATAPHYDMSPDTKLLDLAGNKLKIDVGHTKCPCSIRSLTNWFNKQGVRLKMQLQPRGKWSEIGLGNCLFHNDLLISPYSRILCRQTRNSMR